jgi:hypothetical protein
MATVFGLLSSLGDDVGVALAEAAAVDVGAAVDVALDVEEATLLLLLLLLLDSTGSKLSTGFLVLPVRTTHKASFPPPAM